ncbi:MAG TPA: response regulator [Candidatus Omnitrophota bacterium]|nr:response regulator [Candidatus Omnitrophota bacterium]HQL40695.1 response regulator [Candidatus Omnitrophota bacterium]
MALKVLVADDEPEVLEIMAKAVAMRGYAVVQAIDGQQAWEKIKKEDPDIILLDLIMPGMHGMTILKKLRENPLPDRWQPVVIVSSLGELEDVQKGFAYQADHYITKPCAIDTVLRAVQMMHELIDQKGPKRGRS